MTLHQPSARWARVKGLFLEVLDSPRRARAELLAGLSAADPQLHRELESLLASHEEAGSFLDAPPIVSTTSIAALSAGERLGPYEVTELLGVGGMGEVYRARDTRLGRDVALKLLPPALAVDPERLARFDQEARAASALDHPNIVTVHDVGREGGLVYLVTELLEGQTLAERLAQGALPLRKALELALQIARGLAAAHERGIVHRDVKPENVILSGEGQVKILDFGLAKLAAPTPAAAALRGGRPPDPTTSTPMGTVGYVSPEQVRGEAIDLRSDQFSFGCLLYELLTGRGPFHRATSAESLAAVVEEEPVPLPVLNPRVPQPVVWIAERCLAKDAEDRYTSTRDLARDLEMTVGRLSELGAAPTPSTPSRSRSRLLRAVQAFALLALGALAMRWMVPDAPLAVPVVRALTQSGSDSSPAASPDGTLVAFSSSRDGQRRIWIKQLATGSEVPLTVGEDDHPRFSPDGSVLLFVRQTGTRIALHRVAVMGGEERKLIDDAVYGDFSPDGRRVCFVRQRTEDGQLISIVGVAAADGSALREVGRFAAALVHPRWSWDGGTVALTEAALQSTEPTPIVLIDVESGRTRRLAPPSASGIWPGGLAWASRREVLYSQPESVVGMQSGSGSRLVVQDVRGQTTRAVLWNPATVLRIDVLGIGRVVFEARSLRQNLQELSLQRDPSATPRWLTRGPGSERQPVYSPDGEWVVVSSNRSGSLDLWAISRHTGAVRRLTDDPAEDWDPAFTGDGKLLWSSNRTGHFEVWVAEADGTGAHRVSDDGVDAQNPVATPDGQWILYASANPRSRGIVRIRSDGLQPTVIVPGNVVLPEVSPDGRHAAFVADLGSERATLRVARLEDGRLTAFVVELSPWVPGGSIDVGRSRWLPDGSALAFIERSPDGAYGVFVQDFAATADTRASRRPLLPLEPDHAAESFAISPDGRYLAVAYWDQQFNLMIADNVPGVQSPRPQSR